jgi:hypothetical protein
VRETSGSAPPEELLLEDRSQLVDGRVLQGSRSFCWRGIASPQFRQ